MKSQALFSLNCFLKKIQLVKMVSALSVNTSKYSKGYSCCKQEGEVTTNVRKPKLSFLYVTCRHVINVAVTS